MELIPNQSPSWQTIFDNNPQDDLITLSHNSSYSTPDDVLQDIQTALKSATQTYEHVKVLLYNLRASNSSVLLERNRNPWNILQMEEQRLKQRLEKFKWHATSIAVWPGHEFPRRFSEHIEEIVGNLGKEDILIVYYTDFGYVFEDDYSHDNNYVR